MAPIQKPSKAKKTSSASKQEGWSTQEIPSLTSPSVNANSRSDEDRAGPWWNAQPEKPPPNVKRWITALIIISAVIATVAVILGSFSQNSTSSTVASLTPNSQLGSQSTTQLVAAHSEVSLIVEKVGSSSRIYIKRKDQLGLQLISSVASSATDPALSPDGSKVAYLSQQDNSHLVIAAFVTNTEQVISADQIRQFGSDNDFLEQQLCLWTPLVWDPGSQQIAFFVCNQNQNSSRAVVAKLASSKILLTPLKGSGNDSAYARQLVWFDPAQILVTMPVSDTSQSPSLIQIPVP
jgi:hypothetical protein